MNGIIKFPQKEALKDIPFTESYLLFNDFEEQANSYCKEILRAIWKYERGEISTGGIMGLLQRAQWAAYLRGAAETYPNDILRAPSARMCPFRTAAGTEGGEKPMGD